MTWTLSFQSQSTVGEIYQTGRKDVLMEGPGDYMDVLEGVPGEHMDLQERAPDEYKGVQREAIG